MASLSSLLRGAGRGTGPERGLEAVAALKQELEALERHHVAQAITAGWSWSRVAEALGVSKQAAHKKHSRTVRALAPDPRDAMVSNERVVVTGDARRAVRIARDEARTNGATIVGTEHLLLGVLSVPESPVASALASAGVTLDAARESLQPTYAEEDQAVSAESRQTAEAARATGVSPLARECLEASLRESVTRGDRHLGVEHLLLSLLKCPDGGAVRTIETLGVPCQALRERVAAAI